MKNRIRNQIVSELLVNRIALGVIEGIGMNVDLYDFVELAGDNVSERWDKIFRKIYEKYPYLQEAEGFRIEDLVFSVFEMFNNKDIKKFNRKQIEMIGEVFTDTILTFCKGYNKILSMKQEEREYD